MNRLFLIAILLLSSRAFSAPEDKAGVKVRFLAERCPSGLGQVLMSAGEQVSETFDLPTNHLSQPWSPPARAFLLQTCERKLTLSTIALPEKGDSFVILLVPSREGGFKPVAIPTDDQKFPAGDVYFYNHSSQLVGGQVGTEKFSVHPGEGLLFKPAGARKEDFYDVGFYSLEENGLRPLSKTRWPVDDKVRTYVFFFMNPVLNRLDFRTVDEFIPPPVTASNP